MMKKKVKKIPKYSLGTIGAKNTDLSIKSNPAGEAYHAQMRRKFLGSGGAGRPLNGGGAAAGEEGSGISMPGGIATASNEILTNALGIEDNSQAGVTLNSAAQGADIGGSIVPGWGHLIGGVAGGLVGSLKKGSVDEFGNITYGGIFGRSKSSLQREANIKKNSIAAVTHTQNLQADYYNNPNVTLQPTTAAEGGIIPNTLWYEDDGEYGRTPYGEIYKEPEQGKPKDSNLVQGPAGTQILSDKLKYPGTKDTFAKHYEKSIAKVKNYGNDKYAKNSQLLNDKNAQMQFDEHLAVQEEMKNKKIKKVKNGIPAHEGGKSGTTPDLSDMFLYRQSDGKFVMQDINGNRYDVPEMMLPYIQGDEHGYWFGPQTGVGPSAGKWNGSMNFAKQMLNSKNIAKLRNTMTKVLPKGAKPANINGPVKPVTGTSPDVLGKPKTAQEAAQMARNERTANMWQQLTSKGSVPQKTLEGPQTWATARGSSNLWENPMALQSGDDIASAINTAYYLNKGLPTALGVSAILGGGGTFLLHEATKDKLPTTANTDKSAVVTAQEKPVEPIATATETNIENEKKEVVVPKKSSINKPSSGKKTAASRVTTSTTPSPEDTVIRRPVYEEPIKTVIVPTDDTKVYGRDGSVRYDYNIPERKVTPADLGRDVVDVGNDNYTGSDWRDNLYRMMVLTQPFWDKATAEPVNYESPVYKYMPTQIDVTSKFRDTDQSYALAKYNFANLYPNTGAGMAAGLQAAANRAKQYADIRQYQTNAQNELIGKNVGIYNNWANEHARIMNDVYNKAAANRAAARNINRQNRATALSNWGTMLSDDKKMNLEAQNNQLKANILKPLIESVYENSDELIPMLAPYTMNRNIKKKSPTR